jgi:acyl carrier protein
VWKEQLGIEEIGIHDDFFELGGDSLGATRVATRIRQQLQVEVAAKDFYGSPTIGQLASAIEARRNSAGAVGSSADSNTESAYEGVI